MIFLLVREHNELLVRAPGDISANLFEGHRVYIAANPK